MMPLFPSLARKGVHKFECSPCRDRQYRYTPASLAKVGTAGLRARKVANGGKFGGNKANMSLRISKLVKNWRENKANSGGRRS